MTVNNDQELTFRISSGLKDLIGKELITDQYIAIFELVKNAFDAHATKATIIFENIYRNDSKITIMDNGKGMDFSDLQNKWLFVAYSAKRDGTEDESQSGQYRDRIGTRRIFAGAKGVGRFSCDRLGRYLNLVTVKDASDNLIECLKVNWEDFEKDTKEEFIRIGVKHEVLSNNIFGFTHGTALEITGLRDIWDRDRLLKLKYSLEKLINPNQENDNNNFSIEIIAAEEKTKDKTQNDRNKVNGLIRNSLFESLNLKTTQIVAEISDDGKVITTTLTDRGKLIYQIKEKNFYSINNIKVHLFQLNREAKLKFTHWMGLPAVQYGSVFMYKNGFRIYPFGEEGEDSLGLDRRKQQGFKRNLGTRDLIGRIEINGDNEEFRETTSRDGGLIKNDSFHQLIEFFYDKVLKRLEKYAVDVIKWGDPYSLGSDEDEKQPALNPEDVKDKIIEIISNLTKADGILSINYDKNFLQIIDGYKEKSVTNLVKNFSRIAQETNNPILQREALQVQKQLKELLIARKEAEDDADKKGIALQQTTKELEQVSSQNLFLKSVASSDVKEIVSLQHHIDHGTSRIAMYVDRLIIDIKQDAPRTELLRHLDIISLENKKISTIARFVTKANFNSMSQTIIKDMVQFVNEYVENVYKEYPHLKGNKELLNVSIINKYVKFVFKFRPLELIIIMDNLFSNSHKAGATAVEIIWTIVNHNTLQLTFRDNGKGMSKDNIDKIFDFGFTTTTGSGLGLYHVKQIIKSMNGNIQVNPNYTQGAEFVLEVRK